MKNFSSLSFIAFVFLVVLSLVLSACTTPAPTAAPTQDIGMIQTQSGQTIVADLTKNAPPIPTATSIAAGPTLDPNMPVAILPTAAPSGPSAVAKANTGIYSGPGPNYVLYGTFTGGRSAAVVGKSEDGQWWAISVPVAPSGNGWVSAGWVDTTNVSNVPVLPTPPVPQVTDMVPPGPTDPQATTIANTYVRSGPATNYPAYGIAPAGVTARVIGKSEDGQWWVIRIDPQKVGAGNGWISAQYVTTQNTANVQTIENPDILDQCETILSMRIKTDFIHERLQPGVLFQWGDDNDWEISPRVEYELRDYWVLAWGMNLFNGRSSQLFGQYNDRDTMYLEVKIGF